jgi:integrase
MFGKTIRENGLPHFRFHDLRHYCASIMHALNVLDAYIIQSGGWETDTVTKRVYHHALTEKSTSTDRQVNSHFSGLMG